MYESSTRSSPAGIYVFGQFILKSVFLLLTHLCIVYTFRSESCSKKCCEEFLVAGVIKYQKSVNNTGIYLLTDLYLLVLPSCC